MRTITVEREVLVPKNTTRTSPQRTEIPVAKGIVTQTRITFPPGPAGYTGIRVRHGGVQVIPARLTEWLTGDDITFTYSQTLNLLGTGGTLTVEAYNEDTVYNHTVIFTFEVSFAEKEPEELLLELLSGKFDVKTGDILEVLTSMLTSIVELKSLLDSWIEETRKKQEEKELGELLRYLRQLKLEELANI